MTPGTTLIDRRTLQLVRFVFRLSTSLIVVQDANNTRRQAHYKHFRSLRGRPMHLKNLPLGSMVLIRLVAGLDRSQPELKAEVIDDNGRRAVKVVSEHKVWKGAVLGQATYKLLGG